MRIKEPGPCGPGFNKERIWVLLIPLVACLCVLLFGGLGWVKGGFCVMLFPRRAYGGVVSGSVGIFV